MALPLRFCVLPAVALLAASCAGTTATTTVTVTTSDAPTTSVDAPASPARLAITVFRVDAGLLRPSVVRVPQTQAVATAALHALGIDAAVTLADRTASVDLPKATQDQEAEIVYTLTQFATIERVDVAGRTGLTRDDFSSYVPPILVESPAAGAEVRPTFHVSGTASVFEATLVVELVRDGKVLDKQTVSAAEGAPARGAFDATFTTTPGPLTVRAFAPSAEDGSPQHEVDVPVSVKG
ncbi:MAG: Gmad2 immunoglobulin-like domain-containing protein [Gaiellaceae bacterium]